MTRRAPAGVWVLALVAIVVTLSATAAAKVKIAVTICCEQLDRHEWLMSTAEAYMKENPRIEIEPLLDVGISKLTPMIAGGVAPDLIWTGQSWGNQMGYFLPLTEFYAKNPAFVKDLVPGMVKGFSFNGVSYAIPFSASSRAVAFNAELLQKAGTQPPSREWTWNEALSMGKKLTRDTDGNGVPDTWGMVLNWQPWSFFAYGESIYTDDGQGANIFQEAILKATGIWLDVYSGKLGIMPSSIVGVDTSAGDLFTQGKLGFWDIGIFEVPFIRERASFEWDVQEFPMLEHGGRMLRGGVWTGEGYGIYKDCKHPEEAMRFAQFMLSRENLSRLADTGAIMPASQSTLATSFLRTTQAPKNLKAFVNSLDYQMAAWAHPAFGNIMSQMFGPIWNQTSAHNGSIPVETLLEASQKALQRALDDFWVTTK
jgi:ABC-type glycerol-3-phosphate transport system substrate-binding protein